MHTTRTPLISIMNSSIYQDIFCLCTVCILARVVGILLKYELVQYIHRLTPYIYIYNTSSYNITRVVLYANIELVRAKSGTSS